MKWFCTWGHVWIRLVYFIVFLLTHFSLTVTQPKACLVFARVRSWSHTNTVSLSGFWSAFIVSVVVVNAFMHKSSLE